MIAEQICDLLPKVILNDCLVSRAARQAWTEWRANPTPETAHRAALFACWAEFGLFDDDRRALDAAIRAWLRAQKVARMRRDYEPEIRALAARYGKEA